MATYEYLQRYERPANFADWSGINRTEYYVPYGQHRDSDTLTRSNFRVLLAQLGGESDTVLVLRASHWAVGWVEGIYVHESDTARCAIAEEALESLDGYPVLDESDWGELQNDEAAEYWERMSVRERVEWCRQYRVSVFAARRAEIPDDPQGELVSALAE